MFKQRRPVNMQKAKRKKALLHENSEAAGEASISEVRELQQFRAANRRGLSAEQLLKSAKSSVTEIAPKRTKLEKEMDHRYTAATGEAVEAMHAKAMELYVEERLGKHKETKEKVDFSPEDQLYVIKPLEVRDCDANNADVRGLGLAHNLGLCEVELPEQVHKDNQERTLEACKRLSPSEHRRKLASDDWAVAQFVKMDRRR